MFVIVHCVFKYIKMNHNKALFIYVWKLGFVLQSNLTFWLHSCSLFSFFLITYYNNMNLFNFIPHFSSFLLSVRSDDRHIFNCPLLFLSLILHKKKYSPLSWTPLGILTGSVYKDYGLLKSGFPAESISNSSVSIQKCVKWMLKYKSFHIFSRHFFVGLF